LNNYRQSSKLREKVREEDSMSHATPTGTGKRWKASELRRLPSQERDAILAAAAEQAEDDYRNDPALTAFEAFDTSPNSLPTRTTG
jgi:hypothetical protein